MNQIQTNILTNSSLTTTSVAVKVRCTRFVAKTKSANSLRKGRYSRPESACNKALRIAKKINRKNDPLRHMGYMPKTDEFHPSTDIILSCY